MKVSALVTTYKSYRFIRGCLEDLTAQTLFKQGQLEVIVVISGSPEQEESVVQEYQTKYPSQIVYMVTEREPMYVAWNRAIQVAKGSYLTNANTDDRHRPDTIAILADYLDTHPHIHLAYSNCYVSRRENETFEQNEKREVYFYPRYFAPNAALTYQFGPHPLWRKEVHTHIGLFSTTLKAAGDYDFNLRFARKLRAQRVDGPPLGLYLAHAQAISFKDDTMSKETNALYAQYRTPEMIEEFYRTEGRTSQTAQERAEIFNDFGTRCLHYFPPWFGGNPHADVPLAKYFFTIAVGLNPGSEAFLSNLALSEYLSGNGPRALEILNALSLSQAQENKKLVASNSEDLPSFFVFPSNLELPYQDELTFAGTG